MINRQTVDIVPTLPFVLATGVLTSDNTNVANNDTVTIGSRVYTFKTTLTDGIVANEVLIGADADASLTNLVRAITRTGTAGTDYGSATTINSQVTASAVAAHAITLTSKTADFASNSIATTETSAHLSFANTTLIGGSGGVTTAMILNKTGAYNSDYIDVQTYTEILAYLNVSAQAGTTPTLDIKFQGSPDKKNWADIGDAFTQVTTSTGLTLKKLTANFGRYIRAVITLGGTNPNYTFDFLLVGKI
jgi:hypothetical protein